MGHPVRLIAELINVCSPDAGPGDLIGSFMPFQTLPAYVFETVLTKISDFCLEEATSSPDMIAMIRLSRIILRNAPEGLNSHFPTSRFTQQHLQEQ
jgi:hypothetical protein